MAYDELEDDLLYHYCSVEALYAILESEHLRVTNIRYMNDSKEISWLFEIAKQALGDTRYGFKSDDESKLYKLLLGHCNNLYLDESFFPNVFCACFSRIKDSLSQWRAYASDGQGVAIGFSRDYLTSFVSEWRTKLAPVQYKRMSAADEFHDDIKAAQSELKLKGRQLLDDEISIIANGVETKWDLRAPFYKNAAFHEEDEVRLVHIGNVNEQWSFKTPIGPIRFYPRNSVIVPYIALPLDPSRNPIIKIVLGPRNRVEHTRWGISEFARSKGFTFARDQFEVSSASYGEVRRTR